MAYYTVDVDNDPEILADESVLSKLIQNEKQINSDINKFILLC